jgi:hypothetical protein
MAFQKYLDLSIRFFIRILGYFMIDILIPINQLLVQRYFGLYPCARALLLFFRGTVNTGMMVIIQ